MPECVNLSRELSQVDLYLNCTDLISSRHGDFTPQNVRQMNKYVFEMSFVKMSVNTYQDLFRLRSYRFAMQCHCTFHYWRNIQFMTDLSRNSRDFSSRKHRWTWFVWKCQNKNVLESWNAEKTAFLR